MKRITFYFAVMLLILGLSVMSYAQEQKSPPAKAPVKSEQKAVTAKKVSGEKEKPKMNESEITEVQNALIKEGYLKEKASGKMDMNTKAALEEYQKANNLKVTGTADHETLAKLGIKHGAPVKAKKEVVKKPETKQENKVK